MKRIHAPSWLIGGVAMTLIVASPCGAQSLDERLDEDAYLRGLVELNLPEVLEHYIATHPAKDDAQTAAFEIARQRMILLAPDLDAAKREATLNRIIEIRTGLLKAMPRDPRRATWMADQAADLLFEVLPLEASGVTALAGVPSPSQRERAARVAREMNALAQQAEEAVAQTVLDLESSPGFAADNAKQELRRVLTQVERARRIPFLRGTGALLHAWINLHDNQAAQQESFKLAANSLEPLAPSLEGPLAVQARLYLGLAQARLGEFDKAEAMFAQVASDASAAPGEAFLARVGGVINRAQRNGPQAGLDALPSVEQRYAGTDQVFFRVLLADQRFLLRQQLAMAAPPGDQRSQRVTEAFAAYTDLLNRETAVPRAALREIVFTRLATAADPAIVGDAAADLPAIVRIALADRLSHDEATRAASITQLEGLLADSSLADADRAAALFTLGRALAEHQQPLFAAQRFIELAERYPADAQAERAIMLGVTLAGQAQESHPDDAEPRAAMRRGLDLLLSKYANLPDQDRWRYAAARLAATERRFDDAVTMLEKVPGSSPLVPDALFLRAQVQRDRAVAIGDPVSRQNANDELVRAIDAATAPIDSAINAAADQTRKDALRRYAAWLRVFRAQALLDGNRAQPALEAVGNLATDTSLPPEIQGEAMKLRIAAFQALKKPEDALREIDRFLQATPEQAGAVLGPMLDALQRDVTTLVDQSRDDLAQELAKRTLLPVAQRLDTLLNDPATARAAEQKAALGRPIADAYRLSGDCEAAQRWYAQLLKSQPDALELLLGQAECHFTAGNEQALAAAMLIYRRLAAAGPSVNHEAYWLANLRMLQILDKTNRNTQQIKPRIERLRQQDETLGGERYRRGFEALRGKY